MGFFLLLRIFLSEGVCTGATRMTFGVHLWLDSRAFNDGLYTGASTHGVQNVGAFGFRCIITHLGSKDLLGQLYPLLHSFGCLFQQNPGLQYLPSMKVEQS